MGTKTTIEYSLRARAASLFRQLAVWRCAPMTSQQYEILVLGSGAGGKLLSWHMARTGRRTAVVERKWIGGSCPNVNCLPSKNEIWSAKVADLVKHAAAFGMVTGTTAIDCDACGSASVRWSMR
jgi:pyruvate/2-oxoglutarate dehydrogenase complex dihydrolipoamide dehydrogenase (E3) component